MGCGQGKQDRRAWGKIAMAHDPVWRAHVAFATDHGRKEQSTMGALDTATAFNDALNAQQWNEVARYLTDDFVFSGVTPQPVGKREFIAAQQQWAAAVPDWHVSLENVREEGNIVQATSHITGTHTNTLSLPGLPSIPATGRRFETRDASTANLRGDQIASLTITPGSPDILEQLGVPTPT
jgi:ketosteroid isomerase-like protein